MTQWLQTTVIVNKQLPVFINYRDAPGSSSFGSRQANFKFFGNRSPKRNQNPQSRKINYSPADQRKSDSSIGPQKVIAVR